MGKIIGFFFVVFLLAACGNETVENELNFFAAASENWRGEMSVLLPPPPEDNFQIEITYVYTGDENNSAQTVQYNHILEWHDSTHPSISSESDVLPGAENPKQITLFDTHFLGAYEIGQKWITEVVWFEDGEEMKEKLVFEEVEDQ
ncbi:hypothetical protein [Halalkalibacter okhensis]|uniref:Lipoprotein n=1 Tax=Halalkalibacter okhensis TaxID=333138 RepID=A0A0B0IGM5_9BACI|nr:hypothetical protein [Halalkalibacter okhensis]KHF39219.1 hypothetical protein LQ50_16885 [Halalkalibacter okhensis]